MSNKSSLSYSTNGNIGLSFVNSNYSEDGDEDQDQQGTVAALVVATNDTIPSIRINGHSSTPLPPLPPPLPSPNKPSWVNFEEDASRKDELNQRAERLPTTTPTNGNQGSQGQLSSTPKFATIDLSNDSTVVTVVQPKSLPLSSNCPPSTESGSKPNGSIKVPLSPSSSSSSSPLNRFANGDLIVSLLPLNETCDWVTPAQFKAHLVPEELMAQPLTLTVEDYVSTMGNLLNDFRFNFYIIFYKRVLALWLSFSILLLLLILFSGWTRVVLFSAAMAWLIGNALGFFVSIYVKQKLYRMLEQCIAQVNSVFMRHNILMGVDDRGNYSCHKVNLVFLYFDTKYCVKFLNDMLESSEQQVLNNQRPVATGSTQQAGLAPGSSASLNNQAKIMLSKTMQSIDTSDIVITGTHTQSISQKEKFAEKLLLRYSQRWVRDFIRHQMEQQHHHQQQQQQQGSSGVTNSAATSPIDDQLTSITESSSAARIARLNEINSNRTVVLSASTAPRHCRTSKCLCQFIEEHLKYKSFSIGASLCNFTEIFD